MTISKKSTPVGLFLEGRQGAGKDTQLDKFVGLLDFGPVRSTKIIKADGEKNPDHKRRLAECESSGDLADDELVIDPIIQHINRCALPNMPNLGLVGCLRTRHQAEKIPEHLISLGYRVVICWLQVPKEIAVQRMIGRKRADDIVEATRETRLKNYEDNLPHVLAGLIEACHTPHVVIASGNEDEIFKEICTVAQIKQAGTAKEPTKKEIFENPFRFRTFSSASS